MDSFPRLSHYINDQRPISLFLKLSASVAMYVDAGLSWATLLYSLLRVFFWHTTACGKIMDKERMDLAYLNASSKGIWWESFGAMCIKILCVSSPIHVCTNNPSSCRVVCVANVCVSHCCAKRYFYGHYFRLLYRKNTTRMKEYILAGWAWAHK